MPQYIFRLPLTVKGAKGADPQLIGEALTAIAEENDGTLSPHAVVDAARDPKNVLHPHFEWDDRAAAELYRVDQARAVIRCIRIADTVHEDPPPAFLSVREERGGNISYHAYESVIRSRALQLAVLQQAEKDLEAFSRRYREYKEICELIAKAREVASRRRRDLQGDEARTN